MTKKLIFLLTAFAPICGVNPAFSGENSSGPASDTIIHFIPGTTDYNLILEGRKQFFSYDTIQPFHKCNIKFWVKNNSMKPITILSVRSNSTGKMLADLSEPERNEEITTGKSFCITIRPNDRRPGIFYAWASIRYNIAGEEKEMQVQVRGYLMPRIQEAGPPVVIQPQEPIRPSNPVKVINPVKQAEPPRVQSNYKPRSHGIIHYEVGELVSREENRRDYSFTFHTNPEEQAYGFPARRKKDLVFSWDTLTGSELSSPLLFHLKNDSGYPVTILKIEGNNGAVYYCNPSDQVLVFPDSSLVIEVIPDLLNKGHFYHSLIIYYQSLYGIKQFELKQWGYFPEDCEVNTADSLQLMELRTNNYRQRNKEEKDPVRMYVLSEGQSVYQNARLELFSKERHAIIHSEKDRQGNLFFQIHRNGWDTLLVHVLSPKDEVLQKMPLTHPFAYNSYSISFWQVPEPYTYDYRRTPYQPLKGIYRLEKQENPFLVLDSVSIKKYTANMRIRLLENGMVEIPDPVEALAFEKKLLLLPVPIHLFPVSEIVSGGGYKWYTNNFTVRFYEYISEEQVKKIFAKFKIVNYNKENYNWGNNWTFTQEYLLDRKYLMLLDELWQMKEVSGIVHEKRGIDGMD